MRDGCEQFPPHCPAVFEGGPGNQPDCIVTLPSITNVPDTQSVGEGEQLLDGAPENSPSVIPDLPGDL